MERSRKYSQLSVEKKKKKIKNKKVVNVKLELFRKTVNKKRNELKPKKFL